MDNPNYPLMIIRPNGEWAKVLDSQLEDALADLNADGDCQVFRVSHEAKLIRKKEGFAIRAQVVFGPYKTSTLGLSST